ncbi:unnamed protein product [Blepharisma stoltei]|uniref:Kinesin motor domain-containing protein n=1 Tax=Blepharisma stoltei TaxID=1481888 RepID=A0AAU9JT26_9CILI|nr:unnamed protein product [Blepharisma stoltei]
MDNQEEFLKVAVRVRPFLTSNNPQRQIIRIENENTIHIDDSEHTITSQYTKVFSPDSSQEDVFTFVSPSILQTLEGYNTTIFAYGQTGSGKTHTIFGTGWEDYNYEEKLPGVLNQGIIPRAITNLFYNAKEDIFFNMNLFQIYNEHLYDLLLDPARAKPLRIRENKNEIFIEGLNERAVKSIEDCISLLSEGVKNRAVRQTKLNNQSSRSHSIFQFYVNSSKGNFKKSKLSLCDLAGCERYDREYDMNSPQVKELKNINKSLSTLGMVIHALANGKREHVPYRDSKLTRLLQDSLGGNTKTILIATVSPQAEHVDTTINTLIFADRAKEIMTRAKRNEPDTQNSNEIILNLQEEIKQLKSLLSAVRLSENALELNQRIIELEQENEYLRRKAEIKDAETTKKSESSEEDYTSGSKSPAVENEFLTIPKPNQSKSQKVSPEISDQENPNYSPSKSNKNTRRIIFVEDADLRNKCQSESPYPHTVSNKNFSTYISSFPADITPLGRTSVLAKSTKNIRSFKDLISEKYSGQDEEIKNVGEKIRNAHHRLTWLDELDTERKMKFKLELDRVAYEKRKEQDELRLIEAEKERKRQIRREKRIREMEKLKKYEYAKKKEELARLESIIKIEELNKKNEEKRKEKLLEEKKKLAEFIQSKKPAKQEKGYITGTWY